MPGTTLPADVNASREAEILAALGTRLIVLVGMMGAGKSTIGRRLAARLGLSFLDADSEIEAAAGMSIPDIFEAHGEPHFRDGEARVIARLRQGGLDLAQGGRRYHHAQGATARRPSAVADPRSRRHRRAADQRARTGLSACRSD